jgi:hypothetical protein
MTRNARTKQFRKEIREQYCFYLIEDYKKNPFSNYIEIKNLFYDNFKYIYNNEELVEAADELGLINWLNMSYHIKVCLEWLKKYPDKDWEQKYNKPWGLGVCYK